MFVYHESSEVTEILIHSYEQKQYSMILWIKDMCIMGTEFLIRFPENGRI